MQNTKELIDAADAFCQARFDIHSSPSTMAEFTAAQIERLTAENERLRAALSPFAAIGGNYPNKIDDAIVVYSTDIGWLTLGQFRDAWAAMNTVNQQSGSKE